MTLQEKAKEEPIPRNSAVIALQILQLIPDEQKEFKNDLRNLIYGDFAYRSPEILTYPDTWIKLENVMHKYIEMPKEKWEKIVVGVYVGKKIE
jgi:hypothetical protein